VPGYLIPLALLLYGLATDDLALLSFTVPWLLVSTLVLWLVGVFD
jgi:hypothetical protein